MENNWRRKQCEKRMWMWSGAHGSTHDSGARGPWFDPTSSSEAPISLLSGNRLKNNIIV
jgi:hypothetical protein